MKFFLIVVSFLVAFASCSEDISGYIVNGRNATIENFPHMAKLFTRGRFTCGGAILNSRTVLTAAHCFLTNIPSELEVSVGSTSRQEGARYVASRLIMHPNYKYIEEPFYITADIAVIRTRNRIQYGPRVQPISLGEYPVRSLTRVTLAGWGLTNSTGTSVDNLQQLETTSIPNLQCALTYRRSNFTGDVKEESLCLTSVGLRGVCNGDSGSPAISRGVVVGVASWTGRPCGHYPAVYIRTEKYLQWIRRQMTILPFEGIF